MFDPKPHATKSKGSTSKRSRRRGSKPWMFPRTRLRFANFRGACPLPHFVCSTAWIVPRKDRALVAVGEFLDREFYGDSVRRAERMWKEFLDGDLRTAEIR